jgi:hypothetical protein
MIGLVVKAAVAALAAAAGNDKAREAAARALGSVVQNVKTNPTRPPFQL